MEQYKIYRDINCEDGRPCRLTFYISFDKDNAGITFIEFYINSLSDKPAIIPLLYIPSELTDERTLSNFKIKWIGNRRTRNIFSFSYDLDEHKIQIHKIVISNDISKIYPYCFSMLRSLKEVIWPESCKTIPACAFFNSGLETVSNIQNVTQIDELAFKLCANLKEFDWPLACTIIPEGCFRACNSLESIHLSNSITQIGEYAFFNNLALKSINIPHCCRKISYRAFFNSALDNVDVTNCSIEEVGPEAFSSCINLKEVQWQCQKIPYGCFSNCPNLKRVTIILNYNALQIEKDAFYNTSSVILDLSKSLALLDISSDYKSEFQKINIIQSYYL